MSQNSPERRQFPRLDNNVPVKISSGEFDLVTETANISCSGAYCKVNKHLEPMTKLKIHLLLPIRKREKITTKKVSCEGIIVRSEKATEEQYYNVAIYFNDVNQRDQKSLADYVNSSSAENQD